MLLKIHKHLYLSIIFLLATHLMAAPFPQLVEPIEGQWDYNYTGINVTQSGFTTEADAEINGMNAAYGQNTGGVCAQPIKIIGPNTSTGQGSCSNPHTNDAFFSNEVYPNTELRVTSSGVIRCVPFYDSFNLAKFNSKNITVQYEVLNQSNNSCSQYQDSLWIEKNRVNKCPIGFEKIVDVNGNMMCQLVHENTPKECTIEVGNPINTATGTKFHVEYIDLLKDFSTFSFIYNSTSASQTQGYFSQDPLGHGWSHSFAKNLSGVFLVNGVENIFVYRDDSSQELFTKSNGEWLNQTSKGDTLSFLNGQWQLNLESNEVDIFNIFGQLVEIRSKGRKIKIEYSNSNSPMNKIIQEDGMYIDINYNASGYISSFVSSDGQQWSLSYISNGLRHVLSEIVYPDLSSKIFHYENSAPINKNALTGITDRNGNRYATYEYDVNGRVFHEWHHAQDSNGNPIKVEELTIEYHPDNTRTITNSRGKVSTYTVEKNNGQWQIADISGPGCSNCSNANTHFVYDQATNDLLERTVDGQITQYDYYDSNGHYDSKGQYRHKIEAFDTPEQRQTDYTYDARFFKKPLTITEPSVHAGSNKVTTYTYDDHANILSITIDGFKVDGIAVSATTTYQYDGVYNQISQIDGPRTDVVDITTFEYYLDDPSEGNNRGRLKRMTNSAGIIMRDNIQYTTTGKILSEDKPNGITTSYTYYAGNDRLETVSNTDGTKTITTHMDYLASGEIKEIIRNYNTPDASTLTLTYDDARRLTKVTDQQGNYVEYTLDTEGNQLFEKTYDPSNNLKKLIAQVFDDYDQVDTTTQSGVTNNLDYGSNGNLNQQTNGNNVVTDYNYDALNRLTQITQDFGAGTLPTANTITAFEYDTLDRVSKVTDANNHDTLYEYDDLGRLTKLTSPDTGIDTFTYDTAGNVVSKLDANGNTTSFSYDALNRPTAIDYVGTDLDATFVYDQGTNGLNQLNSFSDSYSTTNLSYDAFGNLTGKTQTINNVTTGNNISQSLSYSYDTNNRLQSITYPSGLVVTYHYNNLNQITGLSTVINGQNVDIANNINYLPMGPLSSMDIGNGLHYSASYDNGYRLNSYQYGTSLSGVYSYDNNHNITNILHEAPTYNSSYAYDKLDRIKSDNKYLLGFTYDKLGNRTSSQKSTLPPISYTYDSNSNKLLTVGSASARVYDNNGNSIALENGGEFIYNKANRMQSYSVGVQLKAEYYYNSIGQRIYKKEKREKNYYYHSIFAYNANGQLLVESNYKNNGVHAQHKETIWLGNRPIAQVRTINTSVGFGKSLGTTKTDIYYILTDHLNTPRKVTDATGTVLWSWNSDAFGITQANAFEDSIKNPLEFNLRFPGQYFDKESSQHYNYFRDYEPGTGRYLESDPIGLDGGINVYIYTLSNPLYYSDPDGLDVWIEGGSSGEGGLGFHQSICVETPKEKIIIYGTGVKRLCISFGVDDPSVLCSLYHCKGTVYIDDSAPGNIIEKHETTPSADIAIRDFFINELGKNDNYNVFLYNCRNYVQSLFNAIKRVY